MLGIEDNLFLDKDRNLNVEVIFKLSDSVLVVPFSEKEKRLLFHKSYWTLIDKLIKQDNNMSNQSRKQIVKEVATQLLKANNTVTTLEIKNELRKKHGNQSWYQSDISSLMDELYYDGDFDYVDNGTYRVYSLPVSYSPQNVTGTVSFSNTVNTTVVNNNGNISFTNQKTKSKKQQISKTKALDLMLNSGGKFFGVTFTKKDGSVRKMKCKVEKGASASPLGYLNVLDVQQQSVKNINLQTLSEIRINKTVYEVL